ncbi:MAG: FAD-dependent oxidoreductase [Sphaerochaeta sp.]
MRFKNYRIESDLTVVGSGMSGICAAIQAARCGLKVALINNRGCIGGNAGCEIRVHVCGADGTSFFNNYARESGIIEELRLENMHRNPQGNVYLWDTVLMDFVRREKNITLYLNTNIDNVDMDGTKIIGVEGSQIGSEKHFYFASELFVDDTGDGTVGFLAGADYSYGREAKSKYNERIAPDESDEEVILSSLPFYSKEIPGKAIFSVPEFAEEAVEKVKKAKAFREIPDRIPGDYRYDGYRFQWYYEVGAGLNQITDNEEVIEEHRELAYAIWDEIKNSGKYESENYDVEYISLFPGKRESRRLIGEYIMSENDIEKQTDFEDTIAHGGWSIDLHAGKGFYSNDLINHHYYLNGIYQIPYRSTVVSGVDNLFVASRCLSASHIAAGTIRLMGTLSTVGQAVGAAASLCKKYKMTPKEIGESYIEELQQLLIKEDQLVVGVEEDDANDLMRGATVEASSETRCEIVDMSSQMLLDESYGLILPFKNDQSTVELCLNVLEDTELKLSLYSPSKKENYGPDIKLKEVSFEVKMTDSFEWLSFYLDVEAINGKIFIEIEKNESIKMALSDDRLNGVDFYRREFNEGDEFCSIDTLEKIGKKWEKLNILPLFKEIDDDIYGVSNIINGYSRNYEMPNIWISDSEDKMPTLNVGFKDSVSISNLQLTFDSSLNSFYDNLETKSEYREYPQTVSSYRVFYEKDGKKIEIAGVDDNYMRANRLSFETIQTDNLTFVFMSTNGYSRVGVYEIRAYS